ncbi:uncharacterized protein K452DRAFT_313038 [Aplosporella prunicola CBS 121167]|uniref:Heterokaryon incompatibility domain-containing protein n=1 Tax=Aplosporella prunicola CBS 121167 TaxID=1176127 RepID=A0A6A6AZI8_9PEZI|nr:uncharacterized protein K452DRAFT_313038 [Aplosporella prunicola CBS 121167]KAF2136603.1 hypothetical protein K452DRAFT_313038 [Aplosporella prunicola CBS 121167]
MKQSPSCHVCTKIVALFRTPFEERAKVSLGELGEFKGSKCPHSNLVRVNTGSIISEKGIKYAILRAQKDGYSNAIYISVCHANGNDLIMSVALLARESLLDHPGKGRIIDPKWIDLNMIRTWYSKCITEHSSKCNEPPWMKTLERVHPELLIDVVHSCIVPYTSEVKHYFTLSYTWGETANLRNKKRVFRRLQRPGALASPKFAQQIPETIRNACEITKCLGERFLWVDSLCIVQDDQKFLYRNLSKMHIIFAGSSLCLVAEAGQDAEFGLRGISGYTKPRSFSQEIINLANGEKLCSLGRPGKLKGLPGRSYHSRAWTFQEFLFSKRLLIFGDGPVEWRCECGKRSETLGFGSFCLSSPWDPIQKVPWEVFDTCIPQLNALSYLTDPFNKRYLTYPEDISGAFSGIQNLLDTKYPGGFLFDHPEFFFDISLIWSNNSDINRRKISKAFKGDPIKDGLPSWSWMGWQGVITFFMDLKFVNQGNIPWFLKPVTRWYTMEYPSTHAERRLIQSGWYDYKSSIQNLIGRTPEGWTRHAEEPPQSLEQENDRFGIPYPL